MSENGNADVNSVELGKNTNTLNNGNSPLNKVDADNSEVSGSEEDSGGNKESEKEDSGVNKESEKETTKETSGKKESKKAAKKKDKKVSVVVLALLLLIATVGVIGFFLSPANRKTEAGTPENFVSYPRISGTLVPSEDGVAHTIEIDLTVEYADGKEKSIDKEASYKQIQDTVLGLEYEDLRKSDSVDYIKNNVKKSLAQVTDAENISNVYIGNLVIDFPGALSSSDSNVETEGQKRMKGLFPNMQ